jgi:transaldolase
MKLFLDTADVSEITRALVQNPGMIDGVTTNPTLIMKSGRQPDDVYKEILSLRDLKIVVN